MSQKGFAPILIILGIVLIAGIIGGVYYYFQMPPKYYIGAIPTSPEIIKQIQTSTPSSTFTETDNWNTYQNEKLRFTIRYPNNYRPEIVEGTNDQTYEKVINLMLNGKDGIEISVQNDFGLSLVDWLAKYAKQDIKNAKSITLDNQPGYRFVGNNMGISYPIIYIKKDNIIYNIQSLSGETQIFDQILATLKFIP